MSPRALTYTLQKPGKLIAIGIAMSMPRLMLNIVLDGINVYFDPILSQFALSQVPESKLSTCGELQAVNFVQGVGSHI